MWIMWSLQDDKIVEVFCVRFFQGNKYWWARRFKGFERIDFDWSLQDDKIVEVFCVRFFQGNKYWWSRRFEELKGLIWIADLDYEILTGWKIGFTKNPCNLCNPRQKTHTLITHNSQTLYLVAFDRLRMTIMELRVF